MNPLRLLFTVTFVAFTFSPTHAQEKSLLWQVSGKGLPKPSYVYGTAHVICADDFEMKEKVSRAFDQSSTLVLEVDLSDPAELKVAQEMMQSKTKLTSALTSEEQQLLDSSLKKYFNLTIVQVDNLSPVALESLMALKAANCTDKKMYEMEFIQKAKQENKTIQALESMQEQILFLEKAISPQDVVKHLQLVPEYTGLFTDMVRHYKKEDLEGLKVYAFDQRFMSETARKLLLDTRNENWIKIMPGMMSKNPVFFAVGVIHLVGEKSILELLKKEGYTITPVLN